MKDDELYVPVKKCSKGHVIPRNGDIVPSVGLIKHPHLICAVGARDASAKLTEGQRAALLSSSSPRRLRGVPIEGQESFLDDVPSIAITPRGN